MAVVVFGSINMDLVVRAPRLPAPGETLLGHEFFTAPGGKGANQAVACARMGAGTRMIGRVGDDVFGAALRDGLAANGVDIAGVATHAGISSGIAVIEVNDAAENTIVVAPGANGQVGADDLARLDAALDGARALLLPTPMEWVTRITPVSRSCWSTRIRSRICRRRSRAIIACESASDSFWHITQRRLLVNA